MATRYIGKGVTDLSTVGITDTDTLYSSEGGQTYSAGTNLSALTQGLTAWYVEERFTGNGGTPGSPIRVDFDAGIGQFSYAAGGGSWYYYPGGDESLCNEIEQLGRGRLFLSTGGTVTALEQANGYVYIPDTVAVTNFRQTGGECDQLYSSTLNTTWFIDGGLFRTGRGFTGTSYVGGGANVIVSREDTSSTLPTGGTLVVGDATVKWRGGNITAVVLASAGAMLDLSEAPNAATIAVSGTAKALARSKLSSKYATLTVNVTEYVGKRESLYAAGGGFGPG